MKKQITEEYEIVGDNNNETKEKIRDRIIKNSKEGYGKKNLQRKRLKYIEQEGTIPKMKGLPKVHKKDIGIRPIVNGKGSILEKLEEEKATVFKITNHRLKKKITKNSEEVVKEWGGTMLEKDELIFSMDVEKMFTNIKR